MLLLLLLLDAVVVAKLDWLGVRMMRGRSARGRMNCVVASVAGAEALGFAMPRRANPLALEEGRFLETGFGVGRALGTMSTSKTMPLVV